MEFKQNYLGPSRRVGRVCYRYLDSFTVDVANGCVRFGFECIIRHSGGAGTQFVYFDEEGKVRLSSHNTEVVVYSLGLLVPDPTSI